MSRKCTCREVMEVLKFVEPRHCLQSVVLVSRLWHSAGCADEVWRLYAQFLSIPIAQSPQANLAAFKAAYQEARRTLVVQTPQELRFVDCETEAVKARVRERLSQCAAAAMLPDGSVFVCGGDGSESTSYVLRMDGTLQDHRDMTQKRTFHAAVLLNHRVYAFGGVFAKSAKTAEKYDLFRKGWSALPSMTTGRNCFTASGFRQLIYLCGGNVVECETFNVSTEQYSPLSCRLPDTSWTTSFLYEQSLVVALGSNFYFPQRSGLVVKPGLLALTP